MMNIEKKAHAKLDEFLQSYLTHLQPAWRNELVSLVLFGSWVSGRARPESDIDLLIIRSNLPASRYEGFME